MYINSYDKLQQIFILLKMIEKCVSPQLFLLRGFTFSIISDISLKVIKGKSSLNKVNESNF